MGYTRLWPTVIAVVTVDCNLYLLSLAMKSLPMRKRSIPIWRGIGAVGNKSFGLCPG